MADTLDSTGKYVPKDLQITSQPDAVDKDKFKVIVNNLKIDSSYAFQFQYVFQDGTVSAWSPGYSLTTASYATKLTKPTITSLFVIIILFTTFKTISSFFHFIFFLFFHFLTMITNFCFLILTTSYKSCFLNRFVVTISFM